jgi:hypothetical protein
MTRQLTILLTNIWLSELSGSEVVIRDLALGLLRRGHRPIVYSPQFGAAADALSLRGVSVIDDLRNLAEAPDIIHAHHTIPCGEALIRFPHVAAIYVCHDFVFWGDVPAQFPQIAAYVAVDEACRDRFVHRAGIDPNRVVVLRNAVDLQRIPPRPQPLPERPRRAMAFGKAAAVAEPRIACEQLGIEYQALGAPVGRTTADPEQELVNFDIVFASARAALESMCCGCAVIVCDFRGFAGLVTPRNFDLLRARNFGGRCLNSPVNVDRCIQEIARYDPADASLVTQRARNEADLENLLDEFEKLYAEILTGARRPQATSEAHERAVARFLHENLPRRLGDPRWPWMAEKEQLQQEKAQLQQEKAQLQQEKAQLQYENGRLNAKLEELTAAMADLKLSRLLKLGRLLRRTVGLPVKY